MNKAKVSVWKGSSNYESYAEVESLVHGSLDALELEEGFFQADDKVVLKPNWVKEHDERYPGPDQWEHVVTHPFVIESVISWVAPQLKGGGEIVACDAPQTDSSFAKIREYCELDKMIERSRAKFPGVDIKLLDLRPEEWNAVDGVTVSKTILEGDPAGSTHAKLNEDSEFVGFSGLGQLYGASYNMEETNEQHKGDKHEYMLCRTPMDADVLINIPKLKCHKKVGATVALKNLVGINANKNWLPHHTEGTPSQGGDQFPKDSTKAKLEKSIMGKMKKILYGNDFLSKLFVPVKKVGRMIFGDTQSVVRSGNWYGNDTCWRMVLDLNKCLFYYDGSGEPRKKPLRYLAVVDGIIGGDKNGPMAPDAKPAGVIISGSSPVSVDAVSVAVMGFNWQKMKMLQGAFNSDRKPLADFSAEDVHVVSNEDRFQKKLNDFDGNDGFKFEAHFGWVGAIEYDDRGVELAYPTTKRKEVEEESSSSSCSSRG